MKTQKTEKNIFYVILFDENENDVKIMQQIITTNETFFKDLKLKLKCYKSFETQAIKSQKSNTIYFIADSFLLNLIPTLNIKNKKIEFVLLMSDRLQTNDLFNLKKGIENNSLTLLGHIPIDNNNPTVINFLVLDFIKTKINAKN